MTNKEAIKILSDLAGYEKTEDLIKNHSISVQDALLLAIQALEQQSHDDKLKIGDRVKFRTMGGWYNGGTIIDMEKMNINDEYAYSCLVKVDELGYKSPEVYMPLPYYVRVLSHTLIKPESEVEVEK